MQPSSRRWRAAARRRLAAALVLSALALWPALAAPAFADDAVTAELSPAGGVSARGTAVLSAAGEGAELRVTASGLAPRAGYAAQVHAGTCAQPSASVAQVLTLTADADGRAAGSGPVRFRDAEPVALATLADGDHIVALRGASGVVACGPLPRLAAAPASPAGLPATGGGGAQQTPPLGLLALAALGPAGLALALRGRRPVSAPGRR